MVKRMMVLLALVLMVFAVSAQDDEGFPVVQRCFSPSSELMLRDGFVFQTVDENRPTLGAEVLDVWYVQDGEIQHLIRHTDSRAGFLTDGERLLITLWLRSSNHTYLFDSLTASPRPLFRSPTEWFEPQWLSNGRVLFNVVTMGEEPVQVVTLNIDNSSEVLTENLWLKIHDTYEFEDAESFFAADKLSLGAIISPDEQFVVLSKFNLETYLMDIRLVRLSDREVLWQGGAVDEGEGILWHPDASSFVYLQQTNPLEWSNNDKELIQVDVSGDARLIRAFNFADDEANYYPVLLDWSNDGRYVALNLRQGINSDSGLQIVDFVEEVIMDTCLEMRTDQFFWSFDSTQFVYRGADGWVVADLTTLEVRSINTLPMFADFNDIYPLVWMNTVTTD